MNLKHRLYGDLHCSQFTMTKHILGKLLNKFVNYLLPHLFIINGGATIVYQETHTFILIILQFIIEMIEQLCMNKEQLNTYFQIKMLFPINKLDFT